MNLVFFIIFLINYPSPILLVKVVWDFFIRNKIWLFKILIIYLHHKQTINYSQYEEIYIKNIH